jgi:hypothetical protein
MVWHGMEMQGNARYGMERKEMAWKGKSWHGKARKCKAWKGKVGNRWHVKERK